MTVEPLTTLIGARIAGLSGELLTRSDIAQECRHLLDRHGVLLFPEIEISDTDLVAFSRHFGEVVVPRVNDRDEHPEIATISLDPAKSILARYRRGNFLWHVDGTTDEVPQKCTLLTAREVDPAGGDTEFASTVAAYDALSTDQQAELDGLEVIHSFATAQARAYPEATDATKASWADVPHRVHPLVWQRRGGSRSMLIGATGAGIVGWDPERGQSLLERLLTWATRPEFVYRHHWRRGDLVMWDNTAMLHRALDFEPTSARLMRRTTIAGDRLTENEH